MRLVAWLRRVWAHHRWVRRVATVTLALAVGLPLLVLALGVGPGLLVPDGLKPVDRAKQLTEERRTLVAVLVATGGAISLWYTHRRHALEESTNRTERFSKAIEQLGDGSL